MSRDARDAQLEQSASLATMALRDIRARNECDYAYDPSSGRPRPCPCAKCVAEDTLDMIEGGWRYIGARSERLDGMPREKKMIEAWRAEVNDHRLGQILDDSPQKMGDPPGVEPTVRDWYVATSVVQWLATSVGMEVLRKAGFEYKGWQADRETARSTEPTPTDPNAIARGVVENWESSSSYPHARNELLTLIATAIDKAQTRQQTLSLPLEKK